VVAQLAGQLSHDERQVVERVVRYHLDLSPPGYRRWSDGHQTATWRKLMTQMAQGSPKLPSPGHGLPIESILRESLPFDYRPWDDVPCRFVGSGRIASAMFVAPATLNLPQRQEVRKVIQRHFEYELIKGAGKGSHGRRGAAGCPASSGGWQRRPLGAAGGAEVVFQRVPAGRASGAARRCGSFVPGWRRVSLRM
jgi:hypothetical protein